MLHWRYEMGSMGTFLAFLDNLGWEVYEMIVDPKTGIVQIIRISQKKTDKDGSHISFVRNGVAEPDGEWTLEDTWYDIPETAEDGFDFTRSFNDVELLEVILRVIKCPLLVTRNK